MRYEKIVAKENSSTGKVFCFNYPSVFDLVTQKLTTENDAVFKSCMQGHDSGAYARTDRSCPPPLEFFGVPQSRDVGDALLTGWKEGTERMHKALGAVEVPKLPSVRRKRTRGDHGDSVDIHEVLGGRLDRAWSRMRREQALSRQSTHVTIVVDAGGSYRATASSMMWKGAAAVALAEAVQRSGRAVQIITCFAAESIDNGSNGHDCHVRVTVKPFEQNVSTEVLMTACSLPGFFRVFGFRALAASDEYVVRSSFGYTVPYAKSELENEGQLIFIDKEVLSELRAREVVNNAVEQIINFKQDRAA